MYITELDQASNNIADTHTVMCCNLAEHS